MTRFLAAALLLAAVPALSQEPPADPCAPRSAPIPPPPSGAPLEPPPEVPIEPLRGMGTSVDLGIGHLQPATEAPDWFRHIEVPMYGEPGGELAGWIHAGWWVPAADPAAAVPLTSDAMVETGYEVASWIVLAEREGGWVRFRFAPGPDGTGWASLCHLSASDPPVRYETWEGRFTAAGASPLFFRDDERHALRRGPGPGFRRSFWLPGGDGTELQPLEVRGDWMRVRAYSPPLTCADEPPTRGIAEEGWVRWRGSGTGPWVWWFTRGC